jgi:hypothetical protein
MIVYLVVIFALIGVTGLLFIIVQKERDYARFQKNMRPGHLCTFYDQESRIKGEIKEVNEDTVVIFDGLSFYTKPKNDVYPYYH